MTERKKTVPSPESTGGAGTIFEQHVDAALLAFLLVRGIPPILTDHQIKEVHFQTRTRGWKTDDFLLVVSSESESVREIAGQVKRSFVVSSKDEDCRSTVAGFWADYESDRVFEKTRDRFAIVVQRGSDALLSGFDALLNRVRGCLDSKDFASRLATRGFLSKKSKKHYDEIKQIVKEVADRDIGDGDLYEFMRHIHVLSYDLGTSTGQTEAIVKSLLAQTTTASDSLNIASSSWDRLFKLASIAMSNGASYTRERLPKELQERHAAIGSGEHRALKALRHHSALILDTVRDCIGENIRIRRDGIVSDLLDQIIDTEIVVMSGLAGVGKSVVAKWAANQLRDDHFVIAFRAEEFAAAHLDEVLLKSQVPIQADLLGALVAGQSQVILMIDGGERLLEASIRDAFKDLLAIMRKNRNWRLVITCREYSANAMIEAFCAHSGLKCTAMRVPPLEDEELDLVVSEYKELERLLSVEPLRGLLRNPYFLDKASWMLWPVDQPLPTTEREFRRKFWSDVLRNESMKGEGLPQRREQAFCEIALSRARKLTRFASCEGLDPGAVESLAGDSLVQVSEDSSLLVAPSHDVLEDWAILKWMDDRYVALERDFERFASELGSAPAIRRSFRKWLAELIERDPTYEEKVLSALGSALTQQIQDDTLVCVLNSSDAVGFLGRHKETVLGQNMALLKRIIRLLQVGCVNPVSLVDGSSRQIAYYVPSGSAWPAVAEIVESALAEFQDEDFGLLLGFIDFWSRGLSVEHAYPPGHENVFSIGLHLLSKLPSYGADDSRKKILNVIAKIPDSNRPRFLSLLEKDPHSRKRDQTREVLADLVLSGSDGMCAARDLPDEVIDLAKQEYFLAERDDDKEWRYNSSPFIEPMFGLRSSDRAEFSMASSYLGPFMQLLRFHGDKGVGLVVDLLNRSADWYSSPRIPLEHIEPPYEMELTFSDGDKKKQCVNPRLWCWYRGSSVGPYVLLSALMALESWLLAMGRREGDLDSYLIGLLRRSESAAITAVVCSIANAFPRRCVETILVLLRCRECVRLDRNRMAQEASANVFSALPALGEWQKLCSAERKASNALSHRKLDLENTVLRMQLTDARERIQEILDDHFGHLKAEDRSEADNIWELALHRMDLRRQRAEIQEEAPNGAEDEVEGGTRIVLQPEILDDSLKAITETAHAEHNIVSTQLEFFNWGIKAFKGEEGANSDLETCRTRIALVKDNAAFESGLDFLGHWANAKAYLASICIREHWDDLEGEEKEWCTGIVCTAIENTGNSWGQTIRVQRYESEADRPSAWVIPRLAAEDLGDANDRVRRALAIALTHPVDEVVQYAATGTGNYLWVYDRSLAVRCVGSLVESARALQERLDQERAKPYTKRVGFEDLQAECASASRARIVGQEHLSEDTCKSFDLQGYVGGRALRQILTILGFAPREDVAVGLHSYAADLLARSWDREESGDADSREKVLHSDHQIQISDLLSGFLLKVGPEEASGIVKPILNSIDPHPDRVASFVRDLVSEEERVRQTESFWSIWQAFADRILSATWIEKLDQRYSPGTDLVRAIFLQHFWRDEVRHWQSLEGFSHRVHDLFADFPPSKTVFEEYIRFLYHLGEESLPNGFIDVSRGIKMGKAAELLSRSNTVYMLESLLRRFVYSEPLALKEQKGLRDSVLYILDELVNAGSAGAYQMRDDFVTPLTPS